VSELTISAADIRSLDTPVVLTAAHPKGGVPGLASADLLAALGFAGKNGELVRLARASVEGDLAARVLAVVGLGDGHQPEDLRRAVGAALRQLGTAAPQVGLSFDAGPSHPPVTADPAYLAAIVEGALLGAADAVGLVLALPGLTEAQAKAARQVAAKAEAVSAAVKLARRLTDEPPNRLYPETFAEQAAAALAGRPVRVKVLDQDELAKGGYGGLVAVGQGSAHPPRLVKLTYAPLRAKRHVALVGKGITFDSGGLSLKTAAGMVTMKSDMAGAAAALGAVRAASDLKLPVKVTAMLCLAENMPSGAAQRPGDVITVKDGQTVEVVNTDAEGRLVLADGIAAARAGVRHVCGVTGLGGLAVGVWMLVG
jgi:leucyl aminopeptidase